MLDSLPCVLVFSATDPTSGAGLQADILTLSALSVHPLGVVTALTAQDTFGVHKVYAVDSDWISQQAKPIIHDAQIAAIKIGLISSVANLMQIVVELTNLKKQNPDLPIICDPILASGRGDTLASTDLIEAICKHLLPLITLLTPNLKEAMSLGATCHNLLAGKQNKAAIKSMGVEQAISWLLKCGCMNTLLTNADQATKIVEHVLFMEGKKIQSYNCTKLPGSYHGSGCTLSSAITAYLAKGLTIKQAITQAQTYTWQTLNNAVRVGRGQYIPNRLNLSIQEIKK